MSDFPRKADVVIIGAGIIGLSTAYFLRQMSDATVVVLDRGPLGGVASPRSAGSLRHHYSHPMLVEMAIKSHAIFKEFAAKSAIDFGYVNNGYLLRVAEDQIGWLEENVKMVREVGIDTQMIPISKIPELHPFVDVNAISGGFANDKDTAHVQPREFMNALIAAAEEAGVITVPGKAVEGIDTANGAVTGVVVAGGERIEASAVLNAAGAWASNVAAYTGTTVPVYVKRLLQIFELSPKVEISRLTPTISDGPLDLYSRMNPGNRLLVGARVYFDEPVNPDDVPLYPVHSAVVETRSVFEQIVPAAKDAPVYQAWAGVDGETPDFQPVIDEIEGISGLFIAAGFSGHGFKLGPFVGKCLAERIHKGQAESVDLRKFEAGRFDRGEQFPIGYKQMGA